MIDASAPPRIPAAEYYVRVFRWLALLTIALLVQEAFQSIIAAAERVNPGQFNVGGLAFDLGLRELFLHFAVFLAGLGYVARYIINSPWRIYDSIGIRNLKESWTYCGATSVDVVVSAIYLIVELFLAFMVMYSLGNPALVFFVLVILLPLIDVFLPVVIILVLLNYLPLKVLAAVLLIIVIMLAGGKGPLSVLKSIWRFWLKPFINQKWLIVNGCDLVLPLVWLAIFLLKDFRLASNIGLGLIADLGAALAVVVHGNSADLGFLSTTLALDDVATHHRTKLLASIVLGGTFALMVAWRLNKEQYRWIARVLWNVRPS